LKKGNEDGVGVPRLQTVEGKEGSSRTSENAPGIKAFFGKYPSADENGDGVLTADEMKQFKARNKQ
jgi:hypothetical protein